MSSSWTRRSVVAWFNEPTMVMILLVKPQATDSSSRIRGPAYPLNLNRMSWPRDTKAVLLWSDIIGLHQTACSPGTKRQLLWDTSHLKLAMMVGPNTAYSNPIITMVRCRLCVSEERLGRIDKRTHDPLCWLRMDINTLASIILFLS